MRRAPATWGGSLSAADLLAALYFHYLNLRPGRARLARARPLRALQGHANTALGAVLAQAGFVDDGFIDTFYVYESRFGMHPDIKVPGIEMCTGALGHGLSVRPRHGVGVQAAG